MRHDAASVLQRRQRRKRLHRLLAVWRAAGPRCRAGVVRVQSRARSLLAKRAVASVRRRLHAAVCLQAHARRVAAREVAVQRRRHRKRSVAAFVARWRCHRERCNARRLARARAAIVIQRANRHRRLERLIAAFKTAGVRARHGAIVLQCGWRRAMAVRRVRAMRAAEAREVSTP